MKTDFNFADSSANWPKDLCGIYAIENIKNGKKYVGQTRDDEGFSGRFEGHRLKLRQRAHYNNYLQNSYNKHGEEAFRFRILEICKDSDDLNAKEKSWIVELESMYDKNGYNINLENYNGRKTELRQKEFELISPTGEIVRSKNIHKFAKEHGLHESCIGRVINGKARSHKGYRSLHPLAKRKKQIFISPQGELIEVENLKKFCKENGLSETSMYNLRRGSQSEHKGWRCKNGFVFREGNEKYEILSPDFVIYRFFTKKGFAEKMGISENAVSYGIKKTAKARNGWSSVNYKYIVLEKIKTGELLRLKTTRDGTKYGLQMLALQRLLRGKTESHKGYRLFKDKDQIKFKIVELDV